MGIKNPKTLNCIDTTLKAAGSSLSTIYAMERAEVNILLFVLINSVVFGVFAYAFYGPIHGDNGNG